MQERADLLRRLCELYTEERQRLGEIIVREMGKPIEQAVGEVDFCVDIYNFYADNAESLLADEPIELAEGDGSAFVRRSSVGVLLGIMPWNYPYYQVARFAGPNLVIGNTILLKHAPQCPESAEAMEELFQRAGFPPDAYINIYATNEQIEDVIADPRVRAVSLTGSERAGSAVAEIAGRNLKKVVLELGGSDPFILLSTDDLDATVEEAVGARLENSGQACNAAKRFIVVDELYEPFLEKFTAALSAVKPEDPSSPDATIGPLSSATGERPPRRPGQARGRPGRDAGHRRRARRATSSRPPCSPTSSRTTTPTTRSSSARSPRSTGSGSEDEAIELANDTPFGLGSYVLTTDAEQALRVADRIEAGMVFVNAVGAESAELPFGGVKRSGFGRELGRFGADEFVNKKLIRVG